MNYKNLIPEPEVRRTFGDLTIIVITAVLSFVLASFLNAFEVLTRWSGKEVWRLNELLLIFAILVFAFGIFSLFGIFSMRRWIQLQRELARRKQAETALQKAHDLLELRVAERTSELLEANARLKEEVVERKQAEEALRKSEAEIRELNEALERRVIDRTRKLAALYEVTSVANKSLNLKLTLKLSLERLLMALRSSAGAIHLIDDDEETLSPATQRGIPLEIQAYIDSNPNDSGLAGAVIEQNRPVFIPDLAGEPDLAEPLRNSGFQTYVGVPIRAREQALGVLSILEKRAGQFDEGGVALLTSIADQLGIAIENARLQKQAQEAAVMKERARLARDLHDSVTQSLYSLTLFAEAGTDMIEAGEIGPVKHNFVRIGETALQALKEMRLLVYELRPLALERGGLVEALHQRLNAVEGRASVNARLVADDLIQLPARIEEGLYWIAQEALNNTLKHAAATAVTVRLQCKDGWLELELEDNGAGFESEAAGKTGGLGLISMRERAKKMGGNLIIHSKPGEGTRIKVNVRAEG